MPGPAWAERVVVVVGRTANAEAGQIPQEAIDAWQEAGPIAVRRALAGRLAAFGEAGLLRIDDPIRAALHLSPHSFITPELLDPERIDGRWSR